MSQPFVRGPARIYVGTTGLLNTPVVFAPASGSDRLATSLIPASPEGETP